MPNLTPFLWYENQAEDAMNLYLSIFLRTPGCSESTGGVRERPFPREPC